MMKGDLFFDMEIEFSDVRFLRATHMTKDTEIEFLIMIQPGTGRFEVNCVITLIKTLSNFDICLNFHSDHRRIGCCCNRIHQATRAGYTANQFPRSCSIKVPNAPIKGLLQRIETAWLSVQWFLQSCARSSW